MKKYKLINNQTKEEHLCDKVTIDGFDYYVSDEIILTGDYKYHHVTGLRKAFVDGNYTNQKKVIATNNPNIDIPKVVDEVAKEAERDWIHKEHGFEVGYNPKRCADGAVQKPKFINGYVKGYNKSQETHPFSEDDMIDFAKWRFTYETKFPNSRTTKELLQLWKEQQPKIVYYE